MKESTFLSYNVLCKKESHFVVERITGSCKYCPRRNIKIVSDVDTFAMADYDCVFLSQSRLHKGHYLGVIDGNTVAIVSAGAGWLIYPWNEEEVWEED